VNRVDPDAEEEDAESIGNLGSYLSEYIGGYPGDLEDRELHELMFQSVCWATNTKRVRRSQGACRLSRRGQQVRDRFEDAPPVPERSQDDREWRCHAIEKKSGERHPPNQRGSGLMVPILTEDRPWLAGPGPPVWDWFDVTGLAASFSTGDCQECPDDPTSGEGTNKREPTPMDEYKPTGYVTGDAEQVDEYDAAVQWTARNEVPVAMDPGKEGFLPVAFASAVALEECIVNALTGRDRPLRPGVDYDPFAGC
jgi:hypothetical protein